MRRVRECLSGIPSRLIPREAEIRDLPPVARIAAIVLAAGRSTRMAPTNKLLTKIGGQPLVRRVVDAVLASRADPILIIVGHEAERIRETLARVPVSFVDNPAYAEGLSTSIAAGIAALPDAVDGALFILADVPKIGAMHIDRLIAAFDPLAGRAICVPTHGGRRGNPVLWAKRFFPDLVRLTGDVGGRALLGACTDQVCEVDMDDSGVLIDVDDPKELARLVAEWREQRM